MEQDIDGLIARVAEAREGTQVARAVARAANDSLSIAEDIERATHRDLLEEIQRRVNEKTPPRSDDLMV